MIHSRFATPSAIRKCRRVLAADLTSELVDLWKQFCSSDPIYHSPFYSPQFTQAVAKVRGDVRIAVLEDQAEVIGFFPFHLTRNGAAKPIGGQLNDYQGPILAPGTRIEPLALLEAADISSYDYNHLPKAFDDLTKDADSFSFSPQMDLSEGYDAFVARKGSNWTKAKREMRRRQRRAEEDIGPIRFTFHDPADTIYSQHVQMKNALYAKAGTRFRIQTGWVAEVLDILRNWSEPDFSGVMTAMHAGDRLIAAHFGLRTSTVWHWWFPSYDLAAHKLGPGIALVDRCAMAAEHHGISVIDFGRGDGAFKLLFADRQVELCEGSISRPGSMARLVRNGTRAVVSAAEHLPLGQYRSYPRRAAARFISGVALPPQSSPADGSTPS